MKCPRDKTELLLAQNDKTLYGQESFYLCEDCDGTWVPINALIQRANHTLAGKKFVSTYPQLLFDNAKVGNGPLCPVDGEEMKECDLNGVLIDICPACNGTWFDCSEYAKILDVIGEEDDDRINWFVVFLSILLG